MIADAHGASESRLARLRRQYRVLSACNRALIHSDGEHELFTEICRALVDIGGYRYAWVGQLAAPAGAAPAIAVSAHWSHGALDPSQFGGMQALGEQTPALRAMRERAPQIVREIDDERWSEDWRTRARLCGHAAAMAMPLLADDQCIGILEVYAELSASFEMSEVALLNELAADLAFGIATLRTRREYQRQQNDIDDVPLAGLAEPRLALEHKLREAIDEQQFELYYQPQVNIRTGHIETLEALLRWNDPEQGVVLPGRFLPALESSGLIIPLGQWVVQRAVQDCQRWQRLGLRPVRVAVNVSAVQLRGRAFTDFMLDVVKDWPRNPRGFGIDLEITETTLLQDIDGAGRLLRELRAAGIRIALDDFGTGYSSLALLSKLPVDLLKIDRSFVKGLPGDPTSMTLTRTIIELASAFGLLTVAEGVETAEQLEVLRMMNCDQSQGYFHCPPMSVRKIDPLLARDR
jgi:EAL domain-containing protein (putative c-di-GMP-specific phosphodiesterase class I)